MHKLREFSGCDFVKFRPFFDVFSRISPLGSTPKMTIRKSGHASEFLENFIEKKEAFFRKNAVFGKSWPTLPEKGEKILLQFFAFLKNSGNFSDFEFLKQPHYWTILKNTRKISICNFLPKNRDGQKKANFTFSKNAIFRKNTFCDFLLWRAYAKMKNRVEKCPVRNIIFCVKHKNCHFLQNKPVGSEIGQKCKNRKNACFATAIWTSRTVVTKLRMLPPDAT